MTENTSPSTERMIRLGFGWMNYCLVYFLSNALMDAAECQVRSGGPGTSTLPTTEFTPV